MTMPDHLDKYEILEELGKGGFGTVYKVHNTALGRIEAMKVLKPFWAEDPALLERFKREARAAAQLRHPYIVTIYEIGEAEGQHYITMGYLPGPSLDKLVESEGPLSPARAGELLADLANALDYAHARGVVHRDIKPSNAILDENGHAVLTDFGLAKAMSETTLPFTVQIVGTPAYIAPEQVDTERAGELGPRTDVYGLGALAYHITTGSPPFTGSTAAVLTSVLAKEPKPPRELRPDLSAEIEAVILKAMSKASGERYASCGEMLAAWRAALASQTEAVTRAEKAKRRQRVQAEPQRELTAQRQAPVSIRKERVLKGHMGGSAIVSLIFSPDSTYLASAAINDKIVRLWNTSDGELIWGRALLASDSICSISFSPDGALLALAGYRGTDKKDPFTGLYPISPLIAEYRATDGKEIRTLVAERANESVLKVAYTADGTLLAVRVNAIEEKGALWKYRAGSVKRVGTFSHESAMIRSVAFTSDGSVMATGSGERFTDDSFIGDYTVRLWQTANCKMIRLLRGHVGQVTSLAFSPDGRLLASAGGVSLADPSTSDNTIRLWETGSGKVLHVFQHTEAVSDVGFAPHGDIVASASLDHTVILWRVGDGKKLWVFEHPEPVKTIAWSPNGRRLATGLFDGTIWLWRVEL